MSEFIPFQDRRFFGLNDAIAPEDLPPGFLTDLKNVFVQSGQGGHGGLLKTRPGKKAQLASALGSPIYAVYPFRQNSGTQSAFFVAGNTTTARIYRWDKGSTTLYAYDGGGGRPDLGTFNAPNVQFTRIDDYLFITGNTDGKLRRTNVATAEIATGLTTPTRTLASSLTNSTLAAFSTAGNWAADTATGGVTNIGLTITDPNFVSALAAGSVTAGNNIGTGWFVTSGVVEAATGVDSTNPGDAYIRLDEPASGIITRTNVRIANTTKDNANGVGNTTRRPVDFLLTFRYKTDFGSTDSVIVELDAENNAGTPVATQTQTYSTTNAGNIIQVNLWFSYAGVLDDTQVIKLQITFTAGPTNRAGTNGAYVGAVALYAYVPPIGFTSSGTGITIAQNPIISVVPTTSAYIGEQRLALALGAATDLRSISKIAIPITYNVAFTSVRIKLGFRTGANAAAAKTAAPYQTSELQMMTDSASGTTYLAGDLTSITANLQNTWFIDLYFVADLTMPAGVSNYGQALLTLGPLIQAGNLTINRAYRWRYREIRGGIASGASTGGGYLIPTVLQAEGKTVISASLPENTSATTLEWYRSGDATGDGTSRLIATVALDGSTPTGPNGYWTWDATNRIFIDNTPDVAILDAAILNDHVQPPDNVLAIGVHAGRLLLGTSTGIWLSQSARGVETGLYFNSVNDLTQPNVAAQGWFQNLSGNENASSGSIQRFLNLEDRTIALFQNLPYFLFGTDPTNFELRRGDSQAAVGCIAPRAACIWNPGSNAYYSRAFFLAPDGLRSIGLDGMRVDSGPIEKRLNPAGIWEGAPLNAAAYASASLFAASDRLFLSVPKPGDTVVSVTYVLDARSSSWYAWEMGPVSGGFVFAGEGDASDTYVVDTGGQIYALGYAFGDTATSGGSNTAVSQSVTSRRMIEGSADIVARYLSIDLLAQSAVTLTITVYADPESPQSAGKTFSQTYTLASGENLIRRLAVPERVQGRVIVWQLSASTTDALTLREVHLLTTPARLL